MRSPPRSYASPPLGNEIGRVYAVIAQLMLAEEVAEGREALKQIRALKKIPRSVLPHTLELIIEAPITELLQAILSQRWALNIMTEPL